MFKIESYVTPILLSYVDKYVRDFKPADAQVSLWGGGVALHNLVLKADVLQQEVSLPFTLISGRIHELLIQVPWTKIMSEPIVVTIDTIECILSLRPPTPLDEGPLPDSPGHKSQVVEAPPGYMQALVRRIVSNITLRVHHLIVKYVQDDIVLSLNVKHLSVDSAGPDWQPAFADIDQTVPVIRRLVRLDDFTLCLDHCDADGKIRFYQEPLLYRCQLDLRVLTRLVSANTRRAKSLNVHLRSSKLAWGVTNEQLTLLLRLLKERPILEAKNPPPTAKLSAMSQSTPLRTSSSSNTAEPSRRESWSEWAWSWLPTWADREGGIEEAPTQATCTPIYFVAFFDDVSLVYKVMETDGANRKRARGILELQATHAAVKTTLCSPTRLSTRIGTRAFVIQSHGKCACGYLSFNASKDRPTVYFTKTQTEESEEPWEWPDEDFFDNVETAVAVDEEYRDDRSRDLDGSNLTQAISHSAETLRSENMFSDHQPKDKPESFWTKMAPLIYFEFVHERSPPTPYTNPYENPPTDFQYSDWEEECNLNISLQPVEVRLTMDLVHRLEAICNVYREQAVIPSAEKPRTLTVEERDALYDNLPLRRINVDLKVLRIRLEPWDHNLSDRAVPISLVLDIDFTKAKILVSGPLYPHRVCSAACQMPGAGPLWQGARLHVTASLPSIEAKICSPADGIPKPCCRADIKFVCHLLLNREYFTNEKNVFFSYNLKARELNFSGSAARLTAALNIPMTLLNQKVSLELRYTSLPRDALKDEESVVLDITFEELAMRGYFTKNVNTHITTLLSARATLIHATEGSEPKQAWLFSARDVPSTTPFLRMAVQWCSEQNSDSIDYVGIWTEPIAFCIDPLFITWLAYKPIISPTNDLHSQISISRAISTSYYYFRRRANPPSSSGRGGSRGSGAELVHVRARSVESSSEVSDKKDKPAPQTAKPVKAWLNGEQMIKVHDRLRHILINVELGLVVLFVTTSTASAVDCATPHCAMERHAAALNNVLAINVGRWSLHSSSATKDLWQQIRHDGPTFINVKPDQGPAEDDRSFPWKLKLADMSCYTMEARTGVERSGREKSASGLRSQLKSSPVNLNTILEAVTTTVTLSVVTKSLKYKTFVKKPERKKTVDPTKEEKLMKYFTTGSDFKPTTLKEFVRGPSKRTKSCADQTEPIEKDIEPDLKIKSGPIVSFGFHVHADTPPVMVRLEQEQVHAVGSAVHCFRHIAALLRRSPFIVPKGYGSTEASQKSLIKSVSEMDEQQSLSESARSETRSELIPIFDPHADRDDVKISAFFWFQWVISRAALVVATCEVKLAFDIDDIITTIDLQEHYNQLKLKLTSASVKYYNRSDNDEWTPGVLGGRVLEAREPMNAKEENNFLCVTITQAQISSLPESWKEELHPKLLQQKTVVDRVWEIYATLAPLEAVLQPSIVEKIMSLVIEMSPRAHCSLQSEVKRSTPWQLPFCYLSAGGFRLLVTCNEQENNADDTLMFICGKITANPHPENPICRRPINSCDAGWVTVDCGYEGRQYEVIIKNVAIRSAQFLQLVNQELSETMTIKSGENPARKWSQPVVAPVITPILHSMDVGCVLAPALYVADAIVCGAGIELNLMSDCAIELSIEQIGLVNKVIRDMEFHYLEGLDLNLKLDDEQHGVCPYATITQVQVDPEELPARTLSNVTVVEETQSDVVRSIADSGVETSASRSSLKCRSIPEDNSSSLKKKVSMGYTESYMNSSDYLEVFVTMGTIELSLYTADDGSPEVVALRPDKQNYRETSASAIPKSVPRDYKVTTEQSIKESEDEEYDGRRSKSLTENIRNVDIGKSNLDIIFPLPFARKSEGNLPLIYITLHQPNLYYWKKKAQKNVQVSLFNAWIGLGTGLTNEKWHAILLSTARGEPDPVTEIPPALVTMKLTLPYTGTSLLGGSSSIIPRGSFRLDIERPVMLEISSDRLTRLKGIIELVQKQQLPILRSELQTAKLPILYKIRRFLVQNSVENATVQTSQIAVCGPEGTAGWDSASVLVTWGNRPEMLVARGLVTALLVASGPTNDARLPVLQPLQLGVSLEATWEAWRRAEEGLSAREPTVRVGIELDRVTIDARPSDIAALDNMRDTLNNLLNVKKKNSSESIGGTGSIPTTDINSRCNVSRCSNDEDLIDHYYKDDLRSGAFKIITGGQLPMAYQVTLHKNSVSWRYPHPRAITRLIAFPLPGRDKEIDCVLELYNSVLSQWEPHSYFKVPVNEPSEIHLHAEPPEGVFSTVWRFRVHSQFETRPTFEFDMNKFLPNPDSVITDQEPDKDDPMGTSDVTAEELSGILRVDSYFAPRLLPRAMVSLRMTALEIHVHNSLLSHYSNTSNLEGYYVSKPLMKSHRSLTFSIRDATAHYNFGCAAGKLLLINTQISSDVLACATGTMEQLLDEFRVQAAMSIPKEGLEHLRVRLRTSNIHGLLHVARLRTLHALAIDWKTTFREISQKSTTNENDEESVDKPKLKESLTAESLEGRISLWVENGCATALRVGQEGTDEVVLLSPGDTLAYRWRSPTAVKKLRFAFTGPTKDWHWSNSTSFTPGCSRVRLKDVAPTTNDQPTDGAYAYINVQQKCANLYMNISGRMILANMLRFGLHYKVRARSLESKTWRPLVAGEIGAESVGRSVICSLSCELVLKIKLTEHNSGWSGDIPLKECPKENVPWLVKVPSEGDVPYISVWCRVVRARTDGRILATIWPLYILRSHLPLDTDVLIVTQTEEEDTTSDLSKVSNDEDTKLPPVVQPAPGRGHSIHLLAPGTTSARHTLSFQYRNIECPVTREAVPLHYGVTDTSVFDTRAPVNNIEEVLQDVYAWLERSARNSVSAWPYSIVSKHWPGKWQPALLQPRCDVTVRYQAIRAGGGCSLEVQLSPVLLLCNASPAALTMRAHDASPVCKTGPGSAISLPSMMLQKPFFVSMETGREAFVSGPLEVCTTDPGRYGEPAPGQVAIDHAAVFAILCHQKVALLTLHYEIKEDINIFGITSSFVLLNRLGTDIMVSPIAVPKDIAKEVLLRTTSFKVVHPCPDGSTNGIPLSRFWLRDRWHGGNPTELNLYLCIAFTQDSYPANAPVPVRLGTAPLRRSLALIDSDQKSMAVVVLQYKHEGRWLVTIAPDPCPQYVVHNRTQTPLAIAQPSFNGDEQSSSAVTAVHDCAGVRWWCKLDEGAVSHYSSPAYCDRYPPPPDAAAVPLPFLTFARIMEEDQEPSWCPPVAIADGEQLVQFGFGGTAKVRVRTHPHSTVIELQDVDQHDISASDIRKRLVEPITSELIVASYDKIIKTDQKTSPLERVHGDDNHADNADKSVHHADDITKFASAVTIAQVDTDPDSCSFVYRHNQETEWDEDSQGVSERIRCVVASVALEMAAGVDTRPLFAVHLDRAAMHIATLSKKTLITLSVADLQIDNLQYDSGQFDFAVIATTRAEPLDTDQWPALWNMFAERNAFTTRHKEARLLLKITYDKWKVISHKFSELTEIDVQLGPLALYIEDAYVTALISLFQLASPAAKASELDAVLSEVDSLLRPLRFRLLYIHPLDLTLTLHTAVRVYIALDQSPLHLSAFELRNMMTSTQTLAHALTVHYLSAAILGAGWVVGGLELLGAPGALAARVGGATGGVRGIASAAAAALLRSLSAWAGSLARNLDLLAGDEEHARRAAAARRRPPDSFVAGLIAGITNFAINILGAVGGLAHHPLVGVAVGETESGAAALRRSLLGALTKPLSATADLVAYAGHGLLRQTGWDPVPQPRSSWSQRELVSSGWRRDCVRWTFRLAELSALAGFEVLLDNASLQLLLTHKFLVIADSDSERIVEMIDFRFCELRPYQGAIVELCVTQRRTPRTSESRGVDEEDEYQISAAAMARVARYTGAEGTTSTEYRVLSLLPMPGQSHALYAALAAAIHHNADSHFTLL